MTTGKRGFWSILALVAAAGLGVSALVEHAFTFNTKDPSGIATNYLGDLYNKNYAAACALFTDDLRQRLGDCQSALRGLVGRLSFDDRQQLLNLSVRRVVYLGKDTARINTQDIRVMVTVTKNVKGKPKPVSSPGRALVGYYATNGKGLVLRNVGGQWEISDCGL